eukprot:7430055-Pyramimonas_sp.AAC.1
MLFEDAHDGIRNTKGSGHWQRADTESVGPTITREDRRPGAGEKLRLRPARQHKVETKVLHPLRKFTHSGPNVCRCIDLCLVARGTRTY